MKPLLLSMGMIVLPSFVSTVAATPTILRENVSVKAQWKKRLVWSATGSLLGDAVGLVDEVAADRGGYVHGKGLFNNDCTPVHREALLDLVRLGYGGSASFLEEQAYFRSIPFAQDSKVGIAPDGLPLIPFAVDRRTTLLLTLYTSAVIDHITPTYRSFTSNHTSVIDAEVHLGLHGIVGLPVSFQASVYFDFDEQWCEIKEVRAFANIPWHVLGLCIDLRGLPFKTILTAFLGKTKLLDSLYTGGTL